MCAPGIFCATREKSTRVTPKAGRRSTNRQKQLQRAYEAVLAAEGSDWNWWYGPEHGSVNDAEFDELYRKHLTEIYAALGEQAPEALAHPIKKAPERGRREPPESYLDVNGRWSRNQLLRMAGSRAVYRRFARQGPCTGAAAPSPSCATDSAQAIFICEWIPCQRPWPKFRTSNCASRCGIRARLASPCA